MFNPVDWGRKHYLLSTTVVALITAWFDIKIIFLMLDSFDKGLGLAAIGIGTFFGMLIASSIFEEHRHNHTNKYSEINFDKIPEAERVKIKSILAKHTKQDSNIIADILAGKGIMRKAIASSLILTYIVLIGLSYSDATLYNQFIPTNDDNNSEIAETSSAIPDSTKTPTLESFLSQLIPFASGEDFDINVNEKITITDSSNTAIVKKPETPKTSSSLDNEVMLKLLEKNPKSLVEHFTLVVTVVIGFYFASNTINTLIKNRKPD